MEEWRRKRIEDVYAKWEKKGAAAAEQSMKNSAGDNQRMPCYNTRSFGDRQNRLATLPAFVPSLTVDANALSSANLNKYTSVSLSCQHCLPSSRTRFHANNCGDAGLQNILLIDPRKYPGLLGRWFPYLVHVLSTRVDYSMGDLRKPTLDSDRVQRAIEACALAKSESDNVPYEQALADQRARARHIVYNMSSGLSTSLLRLVDWLLFWVFGGMFNHVTVQKKHIHMLREAQKAKVPLVFLPAHKSHMDYIIVTYVLVNLGIPVPRIAAGDNLQLPIVSWIVRHLGGFFIKRKLDSAAGRDILYRRCLHEYMERCLLANNNMEFFVEGSRSRSGKPTSPKAGLLSVLTDAVKEGVVDDILIVPVNISYDKILEKNFVCHELMGGRKKPETFWDTLRGAWAMLTTNIGSVRVDFAQPFSLQEYLATSQVSSSSLLELSNLTRSRSVGNLVEYEQRRQITAASHHIVYDITHSSTLMSTCMVAFLLLYKHRQGASLSEFVESYKWLEKTATSRGRSVAFTGEAKEAVNYALHYLKGLVLVTDPASIKQTSGLVTNGNDKLAPVLCLPDVFGLLHLANQVSPLVIVNSVVATSILGAVSGELRNGGCDKLIIDKEKVLENAQTLCKLLAREFIFAPPCADLWSVLNDALEDLITSEHLRVVSDRVARPFASDDEDQDGYSGGVSLEVKNEPKSIEHLVFLSSVLGPYIESYWLTCLSLGQLPEGDSFKELEFLKQLQAKVVEKAQAGVLNYVESCSMDTLRNSLKSLLDLELLAPCNDCLTVPCPDKLIDLAEYLLGHKL